MCSQTKNSKPERQNLQQEGQIFPLKKKTDMGKKINSKETVKCNICYGIVAEQ